ncbi:uncharacterized protein LOC133303296 [Gastrolobium bilobum]|uniref:uncharacterized protein LOC133303296 n=1 Tax=Gastrolobium bilobum TaxID=150636 RepID=UPI002AB17318|nr:uncharacterized protein LOC133303296 [Gastrolobium bilobum]
MGMKKLTHIIDTAVHGGLWKPIQVGKEGPKVSHLMFANDLMLFVEASQDQLQVVLKCLQIFAEISGQKISIQKISIFFSKNTPEDVASSISEASGFKRVRNVGRYLGAWMQHGRVTKNSYSDVVERVKQRLKGWSGLEMTWSDGKRQIIVESDSSNAIAVLTNSGDAARESHLVTRIRAWLAMDWRVLFQHIYKEVNQCADWLANLALENQIQDPFIRLFDPPPPDLNFHILANASGIGNFRRIGL